MASLARRWTINRTAVHALASVATTLISRAVLSDAAQSDELLTLKIRYKDPDGNESKLQTFAIEEKSVPFAAASLDFKLAAAVASFGMLLRDSEYKGQTSYDAVLEIGNEATKVDPHGYRQEFLEMVRRAQQLAVAQ